MSRFLSNVFNFVRNVPQIINVRPFHALPTSASSSGVLKCAIENALFTSSVRTKVRENFPRAKEQKRVKTMGWKARMSTRNGRRLIMRRILKGRFVLTH